MTDINEAIARWMGELLYMCPECGRVSPPAGVTSHVDRTGKECSGVMEYGGDRYDRSLDAQAPVWEALAKRGYIVFAGFDPYHGAMAQAHKLDGLPSVHPYTDTTPAEAAARAIRAALVALGEIEE